MSAAAADRCYPVPIEDWQIRERYPDPGDPDVDWAWEFLRRNPEYQRAWDELQLLPDTKDARKPANARIEQRFRIEHPVSYTEPIPDWFEIAPGLYDTEELPQPWLAHVRPPEPEIIAVRPEEMTAYAERMRALSDDPRRLVVVFDLASDLDPQIKETKTLFQENHHTVAKDRDPNWNPSMWVKHLRILDGYAVKADKEDLLLELYPDKDGGAALSTLIRAKGKAEEFRDDRYWRIARRAVCRANS